VDDPIVIRSGYLVKLLWRTILYSIKQDLNCSIRYVYRADTLKRYKTEEKITHNISRWIKEPPVDRGDITYVRY